MLPLGPDRCVLWQAPAAMLRAISEAPLPRPQLSCIPADSGSEAVGREGGSGPLRSDVFFPHCQKPLAPCSDVTESREK